MKINSQGEITLTIPKKLPDILAKKFLEEKQEWIKLKLEKRTFNTQRHSPAQDRFLYILGEKFSFENLKLHFNIELELGDEKRVIKNFLDEISKKHIDSIVEKYLKMMELRCNHISYKLMKTRWGSCNHTKGYLNFNSILISSPLEAIEYVIIHEIVHLIYPHHGAEFWNYLEKFIPDWRIRRKKLIYYEL